MNRCHAVFALLATVCAAQQCGGASIRTVAFGTQLSPSPTINNQGNVAFALLNPATNLANGYSEPGGVLSLVAAFGDDAPNLPSGVVITNVTDVFPDGAGRGGFGAFLGGPGVTAGVNNFAVWSLDNGTPTLAVRLGDQAPGYAAGVAYSFVGTSGSERFAFNEQGDVTFAAGVSGPGVTSANNYGYWTSHAGTTSLLARLGDQAPDLPSGAVFSEFVDGGFNRATINANGQTAIDARTTGPGGVTSQGIWMGTPGNLHLAVQQGDAAPGLPGNTLQSFGSFSLNNQNHIAFVGFPSGPPGTSLGVWAGSPGNLSLLAATSQPATAAGPGVLFGQLGATAINGSDQVGFVAKLTGAGVNNNNDTSVWMASEHGSTMIAREGSQAPGLPAGFTMGSLFSYPQEVDYAINAAGQMALLANYFDLQGNSHRAIWETGADGHLIPILTVGDKLFVGGVERTILLLSTRLGETGLQDGRWSAFNEAGQIAFVATFTDGTHGVFVSDSVIVPEPSTVVLASMAAIGLAGLHRVRRCRRNS